ncbi:hypothetical protein AB0M34_26660 [Nocardia sp. NPDC050193]
MSTEDHIVARNALDKVLLDPRVPWQDGIGSVFQVDFRPFPTAAGGTREPRRPWERPGGWRTRQRLRYSRSQGIRGTPDGGAEKNSISPHHRCRFQSAIRLPTPAAAMTYSKAHPDNQIRTCTSTLSPDSRAPRGYAAPTLVSSSSLVTTIHPSALTEYPVLHGMRLEASALSTGGDMRNADHIVAVTRPGCGPWLRSSAATATMSRVTRLHTSGAGLGCFPFSGTATTGFH